MTTWNNILVWSLTAIAASGLALSLYMTAIFRRVQSGYDHVCVGGSCSVVMRTPYARALGFPNLVLAN